MKKIVFAFLFCLVFLGSAYSVETYPQKLELLYSTSSNNTTMQEFQALLNAFCKQYYHSCFSGRTYVENSLEVLDVSYPSSLSIRLDGTHSYRGRLGVLYSGYQFYAIIKKKGSKIEVAFYKRSAPDFFHDDYYWESCTKIVE